MADVQQDWPNRGAEILGSTVSVCILATLALVWRVAYGIKSKRPLLLSDYLLIIAAILNLTTTCIRFQSVEAGLGRHFTDPSIKFPADIVKYSYTIYQNQVINLIAVALLKYAICSYLLALKFSTIYTVIIWISILLVTVFSLIMPMIANFDCTPFEANWNRAVKGKCFYKEPLGVTYMQGVVNCVTDLVYVVSPILYLRAIQLPKRTQWGLRVVFLLGLVVTVCSIFKTIELSALLKTQDPTWDGVDLTIWSATELSVGILIASLPPLRKQFDKLFRMILPSSFMTSKSKTPGHNSMPLNQFSKPFNTNKSMHKSMHMSGVHDDGSSETHILEENDGGITKTVEVVHFVTPKGDTMEKTPSSTSTETFGKPNV